MSERKMISVQSNSKATEISKRVHRDIAYFDSILTIEQSEFMRRSIYEFQRFISKLLLVGCRYMHLQRGSRESVEDLMKTIAREDIESRLPHTEIELFKVLENM